MVKNLHLVKVKYHGPTEARGSRVSLTSLRFHDRVIVPYKYDTRDAADTALAWLKENDYTVVGYGEIPDGAGIFVVEEFKPLKEKK